MSSDFYGRDFARISHQILARSGEAALEVTVAIVATNPAGFNPDTIRAETENARTLKVSDAGFEGGA